MKEMQLYMTKIIDKAMNNASLENLFSLDENNTKIHDK